MVETELELLAVLESLKEKLSQKDYEEIFALIDHYGEYAWALDNLCSIIESERLEVEPIVSTTIVSLMVAMEYKDEEILYVKKILGDRTRRVLTWL